MSSFSKKLVGIFIGSFLISSAAFAQSSGGNFFIGIDKTFYDGELSVSGLSISSDVDQSLGIYFGYADIQIQNFGYSGRVGIDMLEEDMNLFRLEGNGTFGINEMIYGFGGLNISRVFFDNEDGATVSPGFGIQIGAGAKLNENFGVHAQYAYNKTSLGSDNDISSESVDFVLSGIEIGLSLYF